MKVTVTRPWQIMDMGRPYEIRTENAVIGTILPRQEVEIEVPPEAEYIFASVTRFSSNPIFLTQLSDTARLEVRNRCDDWKLLIPLLPYYYLTSKKHSYLKLDPI